MNATVARLTLAGLLGRRRALLLLLLPVVLLALSALTRALTGGSDELAAGLLASFALSTLLPLLGLLAGTGVIGPEIDDGSIVYLLSKPISRHRVVLSKLAVATGAVLALGALPTAAAGLVLVGTDSGLALGFGLAAAAAGVAYCALFLLLAVLTRNAVVLGLLYALVWETLVGQLVPRAQALSIQQWALALAEAVVGDDADRLGLGAAVAPGTGAVLLVLVTVGSAWAAGRRLQTLRLSDET